jgi:hypothetical protein
MHDQVCQSCLLNPNLIDRQEGCSIIIEHCGRISLAVEVAHYDTDLFLVLSGFSSAAC